MSFRRHSNERMPSETHGKEASDERNLGALCTFTQIVNTRYGHKYYSILSEVYLEKVIPLESKLINHRGKKKTNSKYSLFKLHDNGLLLFQISFSCLLWVQSLQQRLIDSWGTKG